MLMVDLLMRLLVIEKKAASAYEEPNQDTATVQSSSSNGNPEAAREPTESDALLPKSDEDAYRIRDVSTLLEVFYNPRITPGYALHIYQTRFE
jgi:hypothetical protein